MNSDDTDTVFGYLFDGDEQSVERLMDELKADERFERNQNFPTPVYDYRNSRVVIYPRSSKVRLLQKETFLHERDTNRYDIESDFTLESYSIESPEESAESRYF